MELQKLMENFRNYQESLNESYKKDTKYGPCQKKDVEAGKCKDQFHGAFGSEAAIFITDEKEKDGKKYYHLKIQKPGHEDSHTWKLASEVDGRLKKYDWEDKKEKKGKE